MSRSIPYGRQQITQNDIDAVVEVLKSDFLTQGPCIEEFERSFANYIGSKYAIAVANGTAALHLSAMALGIKPGQKVITTPITFAATANCIRYCDGEVIFGDIDLSTYLLDINYLEGLLKDSTTNEYCGIIPVDFAGRAVDLEKVRELADKYNLWIIEDACHAPGGYFVDSNGEKQNCGNGEFADLAIFSFHPVKHIAAGEGGMITTNDDDLYQKLLRLRTHGITRDQRMFRNSIAFASGIDGSEKDWPGWYMEMQDLGFNYRLTDFQSALGNSQLKRANDGLERRRELAKNYYNSFVGKSFIKGQSGDIDGHAYHLYIIEVNDRLGLYNFLREHQIYAQIHYIPCHLMPYYQQFGWKQGDLPYSEEYYRGCLSLPMYPSLTDDEQNFVIEKVFEFQRNAK